MSDDIQTSFRALKPAGFKQNQALIKNALAALSSFDKLRRDGRWKGLIKHSKSVLAMSEKVRKKQEIISKESVKQLGAANELDAWFSQTRTNFARSIHNANQESLSKLRKALTRRFRSRAKANDVLNRMRIVLPKQKKFTKAVSGFACSRLSIFQRLYISLRLVSGRAAFLSSAHISESPKLPPLESEGHKALLINKKIHDLLNHSQERLYEALSQAKPSVEFGSLAMQTDVSIQPIWSESAPMVRALLVDARRSAPGEQRKRTFRLVLDYAEMLRRLELLQAYAAYCSIKLSAYDKEDWYRDETAVVKIAKPGSDIPQGTECRIKLLSKADLSEYSGLIMIEGEVEGLRIVQSEKTGKFSSIFSLVDAEDGAKIQVRAHMFSLRNNGLINGAYCRLNGRIDPADKVVDIDRVSLSELRRSSWYDDITYRMRPYSKLYPDEMNMFFTPPFKK